MKIWAGTHPVERNRMQAGFCSIILMAVLAAGCASTANRLRGGATGTQVVAMARKAIGTPYKFGGKNPSWGLDCSGLVLWTYKQLGVDLPAGTRALVKEGRKVGRRGLMPGDLVFFDINGGGVSHVGIYSGRDRMIHAPASGGSVREVPIGIKYWNSRFVVGRRLD